MLLKFKKWLLRGSFEHRWLKINLLGIFFVGIYSYIINFTYFHESPAFVYSTIGIPILLVTSIVGLLFSEKYTRFVKWITIVFLIAATLPFAYLIDWQAILIVPFSIISALAIFTMVEPKLVLLLGLVNTVLLSIILGVEDIQWPIAFIILSGFMYLTSSFLKSREKARLQEKQARAQTQALHTATILSLHSFNHEIYHSIDEISVQAQLSANEPNEENLRKLIQISTKLHHSVKTFSDKIQNLNGYDEFSMSKLIQNTNAEIISDSKVTAIYDFAALVVKELILNAEEHSKGSERIILKGNKLEVRSKSQPLSSQIWEAGQSTKMNHARNRGIGLYTNRLLAQSMNGDLHYDYDNKSQEVVFTFTLPLLEDK